MGMRRGARQDAGVQSALFSRGKKLWGIVCGNVYRGLGNINWKETR